MDAKRITFVSTDKKGRTHNMMWDNGGFGYTNPDELEKALRKLNSSSNVTDIKVIQMPKSILTM